MPNRIEKIKNREKGLRGANLQDADLEDANLRGANLRYANLRYANLRGADLQDANLQDANLQDADLWGADLRYADLEDANLRGANLRYVNLQDADLRGANLRRANLRDANLRGAKLRNTCLDPTDTPNGVCTDFELIDNGQWAIGYRTKNSPILNSPNYKVGELREAPYFSTSSTECHPGIYVCPTIQRARDFGNSIVKVIFRPWEVHKAGNKYRVPWLIVWEDLV